MEEWIVDGSGLCGGSVNIMGFKHSLVSVTAACAACKGRLVIKNAPNILETKILALLLQERGARVVHEGQMFDLDCRMIEGGQVNPFLSEQIHGSQYLIPAILATGQPIYFYRSGGCTIGDEPGGVRPVKHILSVLRAFGASFSTSKDGWLHGYVSTWQPAKIDIKNYSDSKSVLTGPCISGATKAALIAAFGVTDGEVIIQNPYPKPDMTDVLRFAVVKGRDTQLDGSTLRISSPSRNHSEFPTELQLTPDLSEIMTFLTLGVMTGIQIEIVAEGMELARKGLEQECLLLHEMGISLKWDIDRVQVQAPPQLRAVDIEVTSVGIYSDHQPFFALMLTRGERPSIIRERVWKRRFDYLDQLRKFGIRAKRGEDYAVIYPSQITPPRDKLVATDLRMAAVLLVATLSVKHPCCLAGVKHLYRGYGQLTERLESVGATIHKIELRSTYCSDNCC
jgi:UDP-N-acetylglucosamine 1-carboxyvinyltransferase